MTALHADHARAVLAFVRRYVDDEQRAQDVVQETFLRAWRSIGRIDAERATTRSYLFSIARNALTDSWRAEQRRPRTVSDDAAIERVPTAGGVDAAVEGWLVAAALERLSPEQRGVVHALYYEGRTVAEAAAHLGLAAGTVKSRAFYAVRSLRAAFEEMGVLR